MNSKKGELIETLWNVNQADGKVTEEHEGGINRNIVECKYSRRMG